MDEGEVHIVCTLQTEGDLQDLQRFRGGNEQLYLCPTKQIIESKSECRRKGMLRSGKNIGFRIRKSLVRFQSPVRRCSSEPSPPVASLRYSKCRRKGFLRFDRPGVAGSSPACDQPRPRTKRRCRSITVAQHGRARFRPFRLLPCFYMDF